MKSLFGMASGAVDGWIADAADAARKNPSNGALKRLTRYAFPFSTKADKVMEALLSVGDEDGTFADMVPKIALFHGMEDKAIMLLSAQGGDDAARRISHIVIGSDRNDIVIPAIETVAAMKTPEAVEAVGLIGANRIGFFYPALETLFEIYRTPGEAETASLRADLERAMERIVRHIRSPLNLYCLKDDPSSWLSTVDRLKWIQREVPQSNETLHNELQKSVKRLSAIVPQVAAHTHRMAPAPDAA